MLIYIRPAIALLLFFTLLTGIAYPLAVTGAARLTMPRAANGNLIKQNNVVVGSSLIGQSFTSDRYFRGRPSATNAPDPADDKKTVDAPYNAGNSSGSNYGPLSKKLIERVSADVTSLKQAGATVIPADAVTTSASGLDPHISPDFASVQVARVAMARNLPVERVKTILSQNIERPLFGFIGEPRVNVLQLNLALDAAAIGPSG